MIEESYVCFDTAKLLKEAGFDVPTVRYYHKDGSMSAMSLDAQRHLSKIYKDIDTYPLPTQALAARWLREVHDTFVKMERVGNFDGKEFRFYWSYSLISVSTACLKSISGGRYDSCEEALEAGIVQVLERIIEEMKE